GRGDYRCRPDGRRGHQSGVANPRRARRLPPRAVVQAAWPVSTRRRLRAAMSSVNTSGFRVETRTNISTIAAVAAVVLILCLFAWPAFASRSLVVVLSFLLTMLTLPQVWSLVAGDGGLVSFGQEAFVGMGAYAMFSAVILWGLDPVPAILLGGVAALALAVP